MATVSGRLAQFYINIGDLDKAEQELKKMEEILKDEMQFLVSAKEKKIQLHEVEVKRQEILYPVGKMEHRKAKINYRRYELKRSEKKYLIESAKHYTLSCAYMGYFSDDAFATKKVLKEVTSIVSQLSAEERKDFKNQVKKTQSEYGLEYFSEINKRIEDAEILSE
ncbi:hypothetical protein [Desulfonema limicola]|nr:hypothetical protein [Desulfonema limicola]